MTKTEKKNKDCFIEEGGVILYSEYYGYAVNKWGIVKNVKTGEFVESTLNSHGPVVPNRDGQGYGYVYITDMMIDGYIGANVSPHSYLSRCLDRSRTQKCRNPTIQFPFKYFVLPINVPNHIPGTPMSLGGNSSIPLGFIKLVTPYQYAKVNCPEHIGASDTKNVYYCRIDQKWYVDIKTPEEDIFIEDQFDTEEQAIGYLEYHKRTGRNNLRY